MSYTIRSNDCEAYIKDFLRYNYNSRPLIIKQLGKSPYLYVDSLVDFRPFMMTAQYELRFILKVCHYKKDLVGRIDIERAKGFSGDDRIYLPVYNNIFESPMTHEDMAHHVQEIQVKHQEYSFAVDYRDMQNYNSLIHYVRKIFQTKMTDEIQVIDNTEALEVLYG